MPRALLTGITGQDGSYLTELLLEKGYEVHGVVRNFTALERSRVSHLIRNPDIYRSRLFLHYGDLHDPTSLRRTLLKTTPDEFYHLAGQSDVGVSFEMVESTCEIAAMGTLRLLEMLRDMKRPPRFFHASSSEVFGRPEVSPQDEQTPFRPVTPYGCAKALATNLTAVYRQTFGLFCCNGILYNHESPRRGENFVTRKICIGAVAIKEGREQELMLGNLSARRDWGDARQYVRGMWLALQQPTPDDFVFASGELHTVLEIVETAFAAVGLDWRLHVKQDPRLFRPDEPVALIGNPAKARRILQWNAGTSFKDLITEIALAERMHAPSDETA
jgi:GDPmannose 4,6-dehydratase